MGDSGFALLGEANGCGQLVAIHFRHMQIGKQQRVVAALPAFQRFAAIAGDICRIAQQSKLLADHFLVDFVVFRHQDQPAFLSAFSREGATRLDLAGAAPRLLHACAPPRWPPPAEKRRDA